MAEYIEGEEDVILRRYSLGTRDSNGEWVDGPMFKETIRGSVQPLNGDELATVPEGERSSVQRKMYTRCRVRTLDQNYNRQADEIEVDCEIYEVRQVERQRSVEPHYKVRMVRIWPR